LVLTQGESVNLQTKNRVGYLHIIKGQLSADNNTFEAGDAFALDPEQSVNLEAETKTEALWFDLPVL
jgi:quercetin 2,3-dioxygenase